MGLCITLGWWTFLKFRKPIVITDLWRMPQDGKDSAHYCQPRCRGADCRAKNYYWTEDEENAIIGWIHVHYPRTDGLKTAFFHGEKDNYHLHLQIQDGDYKNIYGTSNGQGKSVS